MLEQLAVADLPLVPLHPGQTVPRGDLPQPHGGVGRARGQEPAPQLDRVHLVSVTAQPAGGRAVRKVIRLFLFSVFRFRFYWKSNTEHGSSIYLSYREEGVALCGCAGSNIHQAGIYRGRTSLLTASCGEGIYLVR